MTANGSPGLAPSCRHHHRKLTLKSVDKIPPAMALISSLLPLVGTRRPSFAYRLALCQQPHTPVIGWRRLLRWILDIYSCLASTNKLRHSSNQRLDIGNSQRNNSCLNYFSLSSNSEQLSVEKLFENNQKHTCVSHSAFRSLPAWSHSGESCRGQPNTQSLHCHCCRRRPTCKTVAGHYCVNLVFRLLAYWDAATCAYLILD